MFFTSICYRTGARFAKYAQWARHKLSRIECTQRSRWKAHVLNVGAGRDLSQQTHWSNPRLPSAWRMARARAHAVCSVSVTPFNVAITLPLKKEMNVKKKKNKNTQTAAASNFRSSGTCGAWTWTRTSRLSTPCRKGPWRSRSVGRFPGRASLSSSAGCTPPPASALACRSWSRSDGHSSSPPSSLTSADMGRPRALSQEVEGMR